MVGDEDANVFLLELIDDILDIFDGDRIDTCERLIEHDEFRRDGETACNLDTTSFATRKAVTEVLAHLMQAELRDERFELLFLLVFCQIGHLESGEEIVFDRHLSIDRSLLCEVADSCLRTFINRIFGDFLVVEEYSALIRHDETGGHIESCCLACAVWTKQTYYLTLLHVDADMIGNGTRSVSFHKIICAQYAAVIFHSVPYFWF